MNNKQLNLLKEQLSRLDKSRSVLDYSYQRCLAIQDKSHFNEQDLERFESLTGRFARLSDLLIQKMFRLIDSIDLDDQGTVRDRINRAEKKSLIESAEQFVLIRELRNTIAHEYDPIASEKIFLLVLEFCPLLFDAVERLNQYVKKYFAS